MDGMVLRKVRLMGHLAEGIGDSLRLAFDTPARALRLIEANFPGFMRRFKEGHYFVTVVRPSGRERDLREEELHAGFTGDLIIMPAAVGASSGKRKGLLGALLGAVLIGAAFFFSGGTLAAALPGLLGAGGVTFGTIAQLGMGLLLNGVAMMLTPTPNTDYSDVDEKRSFMFNGPTNLSEQGGVVPVIFGTMMVGTTTISASLDSEILEGSAAAQPQEALKSQHSIRSTGDVVRLYYGDLAKAEAGCTLTKINGTAVTGAGTLNLTGLQLSVAYDVSGNGSGIPGFGTGTISGFTRPVASISYTGATPPQNVNGTRTLTFEFTYGGNPFTSTVVIALGSPVTGDIFNGLPGGMNASGE